MSKMGKNHESFHKLHIIEAGQDRKAVVAPDFTDTTTVVIGN